MGVPEGFAIADAIEPVTAWRAWALGRTPEGQPELRPIRAQRSTVSALAFRRKSCEQSPLSNEDE